MVFAEVSEKHYCLSCAHFVCAKLHIILQIFAISSIKYGKESVFYLVLVANPSSLHSFSQIQIGRFFLCTCTQRTSLSLRRLRRLDTWCKNTNFIYKLVLCCLINDAKWEFLMFSMAQQPSALCQSFESPPQYVSTGSDLRSLFL